MQTGSWLPVLAATTNQPSGMHLRLIHVPVSSPCLPPLLGSRFFLTPKWEFDFDLGLRKKFHLSNANLTTLFALIHYSRDTIFWKFLKPLFHLQLDAVHFMWFPAPLKERWCLHHILRIFFIGLVWNSSMAFWACSISDSFTQDASIGWYPFHFTKYSRFHPLSCLDLSMASTSNSGSLWTKFGGGLELCSRLSLETSRASREKHEM